MSSRELYAQIEAATRQTRFDIRSVEVHDFSDRRDRLRRVGLGCLFEILRVWHWHVRLVDANHRCVERIEALALDVVDHLGADTADLPTLFEHDGAVRLFNGRLDR